MYMWQMAVLLVMAGCAIGCLLAIWRAVEKMAKGILSIEADLKKMNGKIESIEAVSEETYQKSTVHDEDTGLENLEAAISNFEKLKRIDLAKS